MVTPFSEDGALDVDASVTLAKWLVDQGSEGLVITGTTGEGPAVTDEEDWELWRAVAEAVTVPVIAGTTTNDTAHSVLQTRKAEELGCDAILAVTPYYNRPSQAGVYAHFEAVASATGLPVVLYDIPVRTGRKIETTTMMQLAHQVSNIVAVKDAAGNPGETAKVIRDAPEGFEVYSGDDALTPVIAEVIAEHASAVDDYRAGKDEALKFLVGMVMKATKGRANPQDANRLLLDALERDG